MSGLFCEIGHLFGSAPFVIELNFFWYLLLLGQHGFALIGSPVGYSMFYDFRVDILNFDYFKVRSDVV